MKIAGRAHREYEGTGGKLGYDVGLQAGGLAQRKDGQRIELQSQSGPVDMHKAARLGGETVPFIDGAALRSGCFIYVGALGMRDDAQRNGVCRRRAERQEGCGPYHDKLAMKERKSLAPDSGRFNR